jgi:hypothetical protein
MRKIIYTLTFVLVVHCSLTIDNCEAQWEYMPMPVGQVIVYSLTYSGNNIIAATQIQGVNVSSNNGTNWTQVIPNMSVFSLASNGNYVFAGTWNNGVYVSTNNVINWSNTSLNYENVYSVSIIGNNIFAGTDYGIYISTNNGISWTQTFLNITQVHSFAAIGNNIFAGTGAGIYITTNNGTNWVQTSLNNQDVRALVVSGNKIFAGTFTFPNNGVYISTNSGLNWMLTGGLNNEYIYSLIVNGNYIIAGTSSLGVCVSSNNGVSWIQRNEGIDTGHTAVGALCIFNNYIFSGTYHYGYNGVFRRPIGELAGIERVSTKTTEKFSLSQNYPNPFNPNTRINFDIPKQSEVKIIVYDILGREVATLVNEQLKHGTYEVEFDGSNFSSGVYYYKLIAGDFIVTRKMVLVK